MSNVGGTHRSDRPWPYVISVCVFALVLVAVPLHGQQTDVPRFDVFAGYTFLDSPRVSLFESGVGGQFGVRPKTWFTVGVDYTFTRGNLTLTPDLLQPSLQAALAQTLGQLAAAGLVPPGYSLVVPTHSVTQTVAVGPELVYRHMKHVTLFFRPVFLAMIHESASPRPADQIQKLIVGGFEQLGLLSSSGNKTNNVLFYGFGGGFDVLFNRNFAWRTQADLVHDHLFDDLLKDGRFTVRFSTGPCFNFGKNIVKMK
jgi:hypothetical protein